MYIDTNYYVLILLHMMFLTIGLHWYPQGY